MSATFIDESSSKKYVLVGVLIQDQNFIVSRRQLRALLLPRQRSIHFRQESKKRRKQLIDVFLELGFSCLVVSLSNQKAKTARPKGIELLSELSLTKRCNKLVFELDESSWVADIKTLNAITYSKKLHGQLQWDHVPRHQEPLLWVADAVAWCLNRGGDWERMVRPMIIETIEC